MFIFSSEFAQNAEHGKNNTVLPWDIRNSWVIWAGQSTQSPMLMMRFVDDTVSIVKPKRKQKIGNWIKIGLPYTL